MPVSVFSSFWRRSGGVRVRAQPLRRAQQGPGGLELDARQADVEAGRQGVTAARGAQAHFGVNGHARGRATFLLPAAILIALKKQADQPAANGCSGLVPVPGAPGVGGLTSRRPSSVREAPPSRPPVVWALAVYNPFSGFIMVSAFACSG